MIANLSGTPSRLCQKAIGTSLTALYTAQPDGRTCILDIMVTNTTSSPINLTMYIGSAADANVFGWKSSSVPGNASVQYSGFQILNINEVLNAIGSAAGLTVTASGLERV